VLLPQRLYTYMQVKSALQKNQPQIKEKP